MIANTTARGAMRPAEPRAKILGNQWTELCFVSIVGGWCEVDLNAKPDGLIPTPRAGDFSSG